jgi:hypothetical protein
MPVVLARYTNSQSSPSSTANTGADYGSLIFRHSSTPRQKKTQRGQCHVFAFLHLFLQQNLQKFCPNLVQVVDIVKKN